MVHVSPHKPPQVDLDEEVMVGHWAHSKAAGKGGQGDTRSKTRAESAEHDEPPSEPGPDEPIPRVANGACSARDHVNSSSSLED